MTNEEAIKIVRGESVGYPVSCDEQINAAECVADYAEKYLKQKEAWEKVKEEIKQKSDYTKNIWDEYPDEWYAGKCNAYNESLGIIDKYLAEVSE